MKDRRHLTMLILLVASVFLCLVACGIPTYIKPTVTLISFDPYTSNEDSFVLSFSSDDLGSEGKVGLLLLYRIESLTPAKEDALISEFKRKYMNSDYDGNPIRATDNEPVVTKTISSEEVSLYALFDDESRSIGAPDYSYALDSSGQFNSEFRLVYNKDKKTITLFENDVESETLYLNTTSNPGDNYIGLYAAVSVQSPNYSNYFWSKLLFVGYIKVTDE